MDPLQFGLTKHQKLLSPQAKTSYPLQAHQKLYQQSTMAFHFKKTNNGLMKSQDIFPVETIDKKLLYTKNRQAQRYQRTRVNSERGQRSSQDFFPSIFQKNYQEFEQPRLMSQENQVFQTILKEQELLRNKPQLVNQISKLKDLGLLKNYCDPVKKYPGKFKVDYVYNDYHSRATNPGVYFLIFSLNFLKYARNGLGSFYTS